MVYARLTSLTNHEVSFCAWDLPHLCVPSDGYTICFGELRGELGRDETHNRLYDSSRVSSPNNMGGGTLYTMVGCASAREVWGRSLPTVFCILLPLLERAPQFL